MMIRGKRYVSMNRNTREGNWEDVDGARRHVSPGISKKPSPLFSLPG